MFIHNIKLLLPTVQNAPPQMCVKAVDIGFVMDRRLRSDGSGTDWNDVMYFVKNIIDSKFEISHDMTHVGAISFDETSAEVLLDFSQGNSLDAVKQQMETWRPGAEATTGGPVEIDNALQLALDLFTDGAGARGYDEVLVLMTDGRYDITIPSKLVSDLRKKNVNVIVVGIGLADPVQLWMISNNPDTVLNMVDPKDIESVAENVKMLACANPTPKA